MRKPEQLKKHSLFTSFPYEVFINKHHGVNFNQSSQRKLLTEHQVICNNDKFFKVRVLSIYFANTENICLKYIPYCLLSMLHTSIMKKKMIFFFKWVIYVYTAWWFIWYFFFEIHDKTFPTLIPVNDLADMTPVFIFLTSCEYFFFCKSRIFEIKIEIGNCHATYCILHNIETNIFHLRPRNSKSDCGDWRKWTLSIFESYMATW